MATDQGKVRKVYQSGKIREFYKNSKIRQTDKMKKYLHIRLANDTGSCSTCEILATVHELTIAVSPFNPSVTLNQV